MAREYPSRPFVGVGVVVLRGDQVLLVQRRNPPMAGRWSLPGGLQKLGETVFEAASREVLEETGITVTVNRVIDVVDFIDRAEADSGNIRYHYTLIDVSAEWFAGDASPGDDSQAVMWAKLDELTSYNLWSETERIIRLAVQAAKGL